MRGEHVMVTTQRIDLNLGTRSTELPILW